MRRAFSAASEALGTPGDLSGERPTISDEATARRASRTSAMTRRTRSAERRAPRPGESDARGRRRDAASACEVWRDERRARVRIEASDRNGRFAARDASIGPRKMKRSSDPLVLRGRGHNAPREGTTPCRRVSASDRARGRRRDREVRCARTGRATEGTTVRSARGKGSANTGGSDPTARSAGALRSASTGGCEASARSAGALRSASTGGSEARARSAGARAYASTGGSEASARSAGARAYASTGGGETSARSAGALRSVSTGGCEAGARSAGARASASTGGSDTGARSAGARASVSTGGSEAGARSAGARAYASTGGSDTTARSAGARASASTGGGEASARNAVRLARRPLG